MGDKAWVAVRKDMSCIVVVSSSLGDFIAGLGFIVLANNIATFQLLNYQEWGGLEKRYCNRANIRIILTSGRVSPTL